MQPRIQITWPEYMACKTKIVSDGKRETKTGHVRNKSASFHHLVGVSFL